MQHCSWLHADFRHATGIAELNAGIVFFHCEALKTKKVLAASEQKVLSFSVLNYTFLN